MLDATDFMIPEGELTLEFKNFEAELLLDIYQDKQSLNPTMFEEPSFNETDKITNLNCHNFTFLNEEQVDYYMKTEDKDQDQKFNDRFSQLHLMETNMTMPAPNQRLLEYQETQDNFAQPFNQPNQSMQVDTRKSRRNKLRVNNIKFKRSGRPFKNCCDQNGKEANVPSKRAIFRHIKRNLTKIAKGEDVTINRNKTLKKSLAQEFRGDETLLQEIIQKCNKCVSLGYYNSYQKEARASKSKKENSSIDYFPEVGDVCYQYSRSVKEKFFSDRALKKIFEVNYDFVKKKCTSKKEQQALEELYQYCTSLKD